MEIRFANESIRESFGFEICYRFQVLLPERRSFVDVEMLVALRDSAGRSVDECFDRRRLGGADEHILCGFNADLEMVAWLDCGARRGSVEDNARLGRLPEVFRSHPSCQRRLRNRLPLHSDSNWGLRLMTDPGPQVGSFSRASTM